MERKKGRLKSLYLRIFWAVIVIVLCAAPTLKADETIPAGETKDINYSVSGSLWVAGTANLLSGASIEWFVYALSTSVVNIEGGTVGWLIDVAPGAQVTVYGTNFNLGEGTFPINSTVTGFYENGDPINLLFDCQTGATVTLAAPGGGEPTSLTIDIKPGCTPNAINLGSMGVVPVAILSTPDLDATTINPENVFLAGAGVAVRGKGNKYLADVEDVNADGLPDLIVKVETENLDPGTFQDGYALLQVIVDSTIVYQGSDEITIVPPE